MLTTLTFSIQALAFHSSSLNHRKNIWSSSTKELHSKPKILSPDEANDSFLALLELSSAHFVSQALNCVIQLNVPDIIGDSVKSIDEIVYEIQHQNKEGNCNTDALFRCMRLLCTVGIFREDFRDIQLTPELTRNKMNEYDNEDMPSQTVVFALTSRGALLQTKAPPSQLSMVSCIQHWTEKPLWDAWLEFPNYVAGIPSAQTNDVGHKHNDLPFDRANGISSDDFYGKDETSLAYANEFVRLIHNKEVFAVVHEFDWNIFSGKTVIDIGGHNGKLIGAVANEYPNVKCQCLDIPEVISSIPPSSVPHEVELIAGDVLDPSTVPNCDVILMKHILDKSMWSEEESIQILKNCHGALPVDGKVIIAEAVLPDIGQGNNSNPMLLYMDAFYVLVGREGQRTQMEWSKLAEKGGFKIESILTTSAPSCSIIVLKKS